MLLPLGITSALRNTVWRTPLDFWADVIKKSPGKPRAYNNYAVALAQAGKTKQAIKYYHLALASDPTYAEPHMNIAFHYHQNKDRKNAYKHYQKALKLTKGVRPELYLNLGIYNLEAKALDKAERCFNIALYARPHYSKAHFRLGRIYEQQNKPAQSLVAYHNATKGDFSSPESYYSHARMALHLKKHAQALESFKQVMQKDIHYKNTPFNTGSCYYQLGNYESAKNYFALAYKDHQGDKTYAYNYAQALLKNKNYTQAQSLFELCAQEKATYPFSVLHAAKCSAYRGKKEKALATIHELLNNSSTNLSIRNCALQLLEEVKTI